ncbi:hypothetical protein ACEQPO_11065 [Bacillus sp. SL00103]
MTNKIVCPSCKVKRAFLLKKGSRVQLPFITIQMEIWKKIKAQCMIRYYIMEGQKRIAELAEHFIGAY